MGSLCKNRTMNLTVILLPLSYRGICRYTFLGAKAPLRLAYVKNRMRIARKDNDKVKVKIKKVKKYRVLALI